MARLYGCDISKPAMNAREAFQWTYFACLGAIKEANGAAMSIAHISSFLDIFIERDLKEGALDEADGQEFWDQLVQKLNGSPAPMCFCGLWPRACSVYSLSAHFDLHQC